MAIDGTARHRSDQILGSRKRTWPTFDQLDSKSGHRAIQFLVVVDDGMHEPDAQRLHRVDSFGREKIASRHALADSANHIRADHRRQQPQSYLGERKLRCASGHSDVTAGDEANTAAVSRSLHARDRGLAVILQRMHQISQRYRIAQIFGFGVSRHALHPVEVGTGLETLPVGGQDDHAHIRRCLQLSQPGSQARYQAIVEGVMQRRPIQGQFGDTLAVYDQADVVFLHVCV